ncbi:MAG: ubiquinone/menaquinone biosynthesis methyltransferase [Anaerolineales bacterium]
MSLIEFGDLGAINTSSNSHWSDRTRRIGLSCPRGRRRINQATLMDPVMTTAVITVKIRNLKKSELMQETKDRTRNIQGMFGRIAKRYDLLNRVMTFGRDRAWRRRAVHRLGLQAGDQILDIGTGTGDLAFEVLRQQPSAITIAADFTREMVAVGQSRAGDHEPVWVIADAHHLPFASGSFDGVISGFLLRNVADLPQTLIEQVRVLRPNGTWVSLETKPPPVNLLRPLLRFHLRWLIPALGSWLAGDPEAYRYLPASTESFLMPGSMVNTLKQAGLQSPDYERYMLGTIAIYRAHGPEAAG